MKNILCFGDSNTHGYIPGGGRYNEKTRWTRLLAKNLGDDYTIYEEGLNGRTSFFDDPYEPYKNAMDYIVPCLDTHKPLDLTILMLGSNDMKDYFSPSVEKIANGLRELTHIILDVSEAPVLLVSPILLGNNMKNSPFSNSFPDSSLTISRQLSSRLSILAKELDVYFLDAAAITPPSPVDCLHLEPEGHRLLADAFTRKVLEIFQQ